MPYQPTEDIRITMLSRDKNKVHSGKVCDICGVSGFEDLIATCIKCRTSSEHIYCLPITVKEVPSEWTCEDCQQGDNDASLTSREMIHQNTIQSAGYGQVSDNSRRQGWFKRQKTVETAKVKFLSTEEAIMLTSEANRMVSSSKCIMDSRFGPGRHRKSTNRTAVGFTSAFPEFPFMKLKENHGIQPSGHSKPPPHCSMQTSLRIKQRAPQISKELDGEKAIAPPAKEHVCRKESIDAYTHAREVDTSKTRVEKERNKASTLLQPMLVSGKKAIAAPAKEHVCRQESTDVCTHAGEVETSKTRAEKEMNKASTLSPSMLVSGKKAPAAPAKEHVSRQESIDVFTHAREVETSKPRAEKETNKAATLLPSMHVSGGKYHSDAGAMDSNKGWVPPIITAKPDNIPLKCAATEAVWKGSFKFVDNDTPNESYVGFQAHPPCIVHRKAYKFSKQMPTVLQFERLPRCSVWVQLFQDDSPDGDDIALYFFPGRFGRSRRGYGHLLKLLETQDLAIRSHMDGVELLLFTSKQMHRDFQRIGMQHYLWGVFRCVKTKETVIKESMNIPVSVPPLEHPGDDRSNKDNDQVVDMEIDMVGGKNVGRVDVAVGNVKKEQCNNCDSFPGFTVKVENMFASVEPLGSPHTYLDAPPGYEEVHRLKLRGNVSEPTSKQNPGHNGVKATIKKEDTSAELFSVGIMGSRSLQFQTASRGPVKVPADQLPANPTSKNPLHFSEMGKKSPSTRKGGKVETGSERRCPEVDEREK